MATPSTVTPLGPVQEELEADAERATRIIDTIRRPFVGSRRWDNATPKKVDKPNPMKRKQKTPSRTWLHRVAAKFTISRGARHTLKSNTGEKGDWREGTEKTSRRTGFKRKPIPSFAPSPDAGDGRDKNDDVPSSSQSAYSSDEASTRQTSTHRSSTSIRTPRSIEAHSADSADATTDQVWDFGEGELYSGQSEDEPNTVSLSSVGITILITKNSTYQVPEELQVGHLCTTSSCTTNGFRLIDCFRLIDFRFGANIYHVALLTV